MHRSRRRHLVGLLLLVMVGFFVRAISLDAQSLWRDEVDALRFATAPWAEMVNNFTRPGWNGPLYYLALRGWIAAAGASEYAIRFFSLFFGVLCIPLMYVLGRRVFDCTTGLVSALLAAFSPYFVWYSQEAKMYTLILALTLLAVYGLRRALDGGGPRWWATQILATSLTFYSHILAALLVPVQAAIALIWWPLLRKSWKGALVSIACLTLPYLPLAVWQAPLALQARETGFHSYTLRQMIVILLNGWSTGIRGWGGSWAAALMGLLAVLGAAASTPWLSAEPQAEQGSGGTRPLRGHWAALIWLTLPLLCLWLISIRQPLFTDRYLIWTAPAFYLLIGRALGSLALSRDWTRWVVIPLLGGVLLASVANLRLQTSEPIKADFRAAASYVSSYGESGNSSAEAGTTPSDELVIFQIPYARYTFDYYFPVEEYPHADGLYTNHRAPSGGYQMGKDQAWQQMRAITAGHDVAWFVASEVGMWDERGLVKEWLDTNALRVAEAHFKRVDVYRYDLSE